MSKTLDAGERQVGAASTSDGMYEGSPSLVVMQPGSNRNHMDTVKSEQRAWMVDYLMNPVELYNAVNPNNDISIVLKGIKSKVRG
jgi:hypothetical protein